MTNDGVAPGDHIGRTAHSPLNCLLNLDAVHIDVQRRAELENMLDTLTSEMRERIQELEQVPLPECICLVILKYSSIRFTRKRGGCKNRGLLHLENCERWRCGGTTAQQCVHNR